MSPESSGNESEIRKSKRNSKISEWLKPEEEIKEEESSNKKYYIIAGMLILAGLAWYYFDDIKPVGASLLETIRSFRPGPNGDSTDNTNGIHSDTMKNIKQSVKDKFYKENSTSELYQNENSYQATIKPIDLIDKTPIATSSSVKLEEFADQNKWAEHKLPDYESLHSPIQQQLTGLLEINDEKFWRIF